MVQLDSSAPSFPGSLPPRLVQFLSNTSVQEPSTPSGGHDNLQYGSEHSSHLHEGRQPKPSAPQGLPQSPPQQNRTMRSFVDGIIAPFMNCVQPPIHACVSPRHEDWKVSSPYGFSYKRGHQPMRSRTPSSPYMDSSLSVGSAHPPQPAYVTPSRPGSGISQVLLEGISKPHDNDVVCGRGGSNIKHLGNQHFRDLIAANKAVYAGLTKKQKMMMARQIVDIVHNTNPSGRFLARDAKTGLWYDIGLPRSLEKTSQALREKTTNQARTGDSKHPVSPTPTVASSACSSNDPMSPLSQVSSNSRLSRSGSFRTVEAPTVVIPSRLRHLYGHSQTEKPSVPKQSYLTGEIHPALLSELETPALLQQPSLSGPTPITLPYPAPPFAYPQHTPPPRPVLSQSEQRNTILMNRRVTGETPPPHPPLRPTSSFGQQPPLPTFLVTPVRPSSQCLLPRATVPILSTASSSSMTLKTKNTQSLAPMAVHPAVVGHEDSPQSNSSPERFQELKRQKIGGAVRHVSSASSTNLSQAVESCLNLEERVVGKGLTPPSLIMHSRSLSPRRGTPSRASSEDVLEYEMDGLAALSTAAFLRLDETD